MFLHPRFLYCPPENTYVHRFWVHHSYTTGSPRRSNLTHENKSPAARTQLHRSEVSPSQWCTHFAFVYSTQRTIYEKTPHSKTSFGFLGRTYNKGLRLYLIGLPVSIYFIICKKARSVKFFLFFFKILCMLAGKAAL